MNESQGHLQKVKFYTNIINDFIYTCCAGGVMAKWLERWPLVLKFPGSKHRAGVSKKKTVARDYEKKLSVHQAVSGYLGNV